MLSTGWKQIDQALHGGLRRGAVHEWFAAPAAPAAPPAGRFQSDFRGWWPPLVMLIHLARQAIARDQSGGKIVLWIGRHCWPNPQSLLNQRDTEAQRENWDSKSRSQSSALWLCASVVQKKTQNDLLARSLFIDAPDPASRLWAIDLALRSPATAIVVADGSQLDMAGTRRLQLAAEAGGTLALLARPARELKMLSAAATRWRVRGLPVNCCEPQRHRDAEKRVEWAKLDRQLNHIVSSSTSLRLCGSSRINFAPRWIVELLRCKGVQPVAAQKELEPQKRRDAEKDVEVENTIFHSSSVSLCLSGSPLFWAMEYSRAEGVVHLSADLAGRSGASPLAEDAGSSGGGELRRIA